MKAGYGDSLKARVRAAPCDAKVYTELVTVAAEDVRQRKAEADAATLSNVETFEDGSVRLTASNTVKIQYTTGADYLTDITPTSNPQRGVFWTVDDTVGQDAVLRKIEVRLTRRRVGGNAAFDGKFALSVYGIAVQNADKVQLRKIADTPTALASAMTADEELVAFGFGGLDASQPPVITLNDGIRVPQRGAAPTGLDLRGKRALLIVVTAHGGTNSNYGLVSNAAAANDQTTGGAGTLSHRTLTPSNVLVDGTNQYVPYVSAVADGTGMVRCAFTVGSYPATGTLSYLIAGGDQLDLGAAVTGTVEFVVRKRVPQGTTLTTYARVAAIDPWVAVVDGQVPADVGLAVSQTYEMKAEYAANAAQDVTPALYAIGIRDRTVTDVTDLVTAGSWDSLNESVNPLTGEVTIAEAEIGLARTGDLDYRGIEGTLAAATFGTLEVRSYIGHPDLARSEYLLCDWWRVDDYVLTPTEARLTLVGILERLKGRYPAPGSTRYGYLLKAATATGTAGADFTRVLSEATESAGTIACSIAAGASESSYGYTNANVPNLAAWPTGNWTAKVSVAAAHSNIYLKLRVSRVDGAGTTVAESTAYTEEQQLSSTGTKVFTWNNVAWTAGAATNRLRVEYAFRNSDGGAAHSVTLDTGTLNSEVIAPWTPTTATSPTVYDSQTVQAVYSDWMTSVVGLAERYRGALPVNVTDVLSKQILDADGKRELERIAFVDGGCVVASQGVISYRNLYKPRATVVATFPMEELAAPAAAAGFRARVPSFTVPYGYDGAAFRGEVTTQHATALSTYGVSRIDNPDQRLEDDTARYLPGPKLAAEIGSNIVNAMGFGLLQVSGRPLIKYPELELGDAVAIETDQLALKDPLSGLAIRGPVWAFGVVVGLTGIWRDEVTVWVRGYYDLYATSASVARREPFEVVLVTPVDYSAKDRPEVARVGFRAWPSTSTTIRYAYLAASAAIPNRDALDLWMTYTAGDVVEVERDTAAQTVLHAYGTYNGVQGPVVSFPVEPYTAATVGALAAVETAGAVTWTVSGLSPAVRLVRWYMRRSNAAGNYPTDTGGSGGTLDETYAITEKAVNPLRGGSLSQLHTGAVYDAVTNKYSTVIAVPIDYNGIAGTRLAATYTYVGTATRAPATPAWTVNTVGSTTVERTNDYSWAAGTMLAADDLKIYAVVDSVEYQVAEETTDPTTTTSKTNVSFGAMSGPGAIFPDSTGPNHVHLYVWKLYSGATLLNTGYMTPTYGETLKYWL